MMWHLSRDLKDAQEMGRQRVEDRCEEVNI